MNVNEMLCQNLITTNNLTSAQYNDVQDLYNLCKLHEDLEGLLFLESELNEYPDFPCFTLLYNDTVLISFLSVFIPNEKECEIYAYTHPDYRKKRVFTNLFESALSHIEDYQIEHIYFINEPKSISGKSALENMNAENFCSEFMMKLNPDFIAMPKNSLTLEMNDSREFYRVTLDTEVIGECKMDHSNSCSTIYDFEIIPDRRGNGFGTEMLLLIIEDLLKNNYQTVVLHVSSNNKAAYKLYSTNGFAVIKQVDYWSF